MQNNSIIFLKLGGSLITDKNRPHTVRKKILSRLVQEISEGLDQPHGKRLLIGHGSGSFGHTAAKIHQTRSGVFNPDQWAGFVDVWKQARQLNEIVIESLQKAGLPVMAFPPSAAVTTRSGKIISWDTLPLEAAFKANIVPVIYGDVIFDTDLGGTILSTEELFVLLSTRLHPSHILLAGLETGVWLNFPARNKIISEITPENFLSLVPSIKGSAAVDVTGGMYEKVAGMLKLIEKEPQLNVSIFSGMKPGILLQAINGEKPGTLIHSAGNGEKTS